MPSRIHRGFHRIGVVLAVPVLLAAVGIAAHEGWWAWSTRDEYAGFKDAPNATSPFDQLMASSYVPHVADYTIAGLLLILAVALYAAARAIGWILDGFLSPRT